MVRLWPFPERHLHSCKLFNLPSYFGFYFICNIKFSHILFVFIILQLPNILGFVLGLLQMILYAIYTKASKITEEKNLPEEPLKNIVILGTLGASEVYPVDIPVEAKVNGDILIEEAKHNEQIEEPQKPKISLEVISKDGVQQNEICVAI